MHSKGGGARHYINGYMVTYWGRNNSRLEINNQEGTGKSLWKIRKIFH